MVLPVAINQLKCLSDRNLGTLKTIQNLTLFNPIHGGGGGGGGLKVPTLIKNDRNIADKGI